MQNMEDETSQERRLKIAVEDLFLLCQRVKLKLCDGDTNGATELLDKAQKIAKRVGVKESNIRPV